jgi:hypothetical protein
VSIGSATASHTTNVRKTPDVVTEPTGSAGGAPTVRVTVDAVTVDAVGRTNRK